MNIYWYWPYIRPEHLPLAAATPGPGDLLGVHSVAGRVAPGDAPPRVRLDTTLADVPPRSAGTAAWLASRATVYQRRVHQRRRAVAEHHYGVAHIMFANYFTDGVALPRLTRRVPVVTSVHDAVPHESRVPAAVERRLLARLYDRCGTIVVHHASVADRLIADFGVDPARIHTIDHWVLPAPFEDRAAPGEVPTVLCFGALRHNKGLDVLLEAATALRSPSSPAVRIVVAGRGADDLEARLRTAHAAGTIEAEIGYVEPARKHALYRRADLVVLPYTSFASQSGVLHDAYAHHRPVVVTDVGALGASVRADGTGRVVPAADPDALADAITGLLGAPREWERAARRAGEVAATRTPEIVGTRLRSLYGTVVRG